MTTIDSLISFIEIESESKYLIWILNHVSESNNVYCFLFEHIPYSNNIYNMIVIYYTHLSKIKCLKFYSIYFNT